MSSPVIWNGDFAKSLKDQFKLAEAAYILTGVDDPTIVPKFAPKSSLYLNKTNGHLYTKQDNGLSINWALLLSGSFVTSVSGTAPVVSSGGATPAISMPVADSTHDGYLSQGDWSTFNSKGNGTVTSVSGTAPVVSSGGATPAISMPVADSTHDGYLSSTDWNTFNTGGSGSINILQVQIFS